MSKYICKDCGTGFAVRPPRDCLSCGSGNIAIVADSIPEEPSGVSEEEYVDKMLRHLLEDLCEQVSNAPAASVDFRDNQIERAIERMRPYLVSEERKG